MIGGEFFGMVPGVGMEGSNHRGRRGALKESGRTALDRTAPSTALRAGLGGYPHISVSLDLRSRGIFKFLPNL